MNRLRRIPSWGWVAIAAVAVLAFGAAATAVAGRDSNAQELTLVRTENSPNVGAIYNRLLRDLFTKHPDEWGEAYVDGDMLVVNTVTRSPQEAAALLKEMGITGGVRLRHVGASIDDYEAAMDAISASDKLMAEVSQFGPDYRTASLQISLRCDSTADLTVDDFIAVLLKAANGDPADVVPVVMAPCSDRMTAD